MVDCATNPASLKKHFKKNIHVSYLESGAVITVKMTFNKDFLGSAKNAACGVLL